MTETQRAELLLRGGHVLTPDGEAQAVAIAGGRIVAVGDDLDGWIGPETEVLELEGKLVTPGLHDAHTHLLGGALTRDQLDLTRCWEDEHLAEAVAARIAERGPEAWVLGRGWDADKFPGGEWPSLASLDAVSPDTPVLLRRRDGHAAIANTKALQLAGIGPETPDPEGGELLRDDEGNLTGILLEDPALELVSVHVERPSAERQEALLAVAVRELSAYGITSVDDDPSFDDRLEPAARYTALYERGELPLRVRIWRKLGRDLDALRAEEQALTAPRERIDYGLLKGYLDGSLGSRTALMLEPYHDAGTYGVQVTPTEVLQERALAAHRAGYQVGLHAIGDHAARLALEIYEAIAEAEGPDAVRERRHRIEHAQFFAPSDVYRCGDLGAVASVQPIHLAEDMQIAARRLGSERAERGYPWRSLMAAGAPLALGTDYPVEELDPWQGIHCAVHRTSPRDPGADPLGIDERLTLREALVAYTHGAAFAAHLEHERGSIAPGQLADLAVFDPNPLRQHPAFMHETACVLTILGGEVVHRA
ncbi:MAG: amidohydrolase [Planctomycetota bacterium]